MTLLRTSVVATVLLLTYVLSVSAQDYCGMQHAAAPIEPLGSISTHKGCHLPTTGTVRGLVLFLQTRNDQEADDAWPSRQLPTWSDRFARELERYFAVMSNNTLDLELDVHPAAQLTAMQEIEYIWQGRKYGDATRDMLQLLDDSIDYSIYDNWNSEGRPYSVLPSGEGKVDLVIVVYRRIEDTRFLNINGVSDLGFAGYLFTDSMRTYIYGGSGASNDAGASGVTVTQGPGLGIVTQYDWAMSVTIHELLHKFYGDGHPAGIYGGLGVLSNSGGGAALNSFERHALGYLDFNMIPPGEDAIITVRDYLTYNEAWALPLARANWYYTFEFRNRSTEYDSAPATGLYIYRVFDSESRSQKVVQVMSADGNYQWKLDPSSGRPVKDHPDALAGYNVYQKIPIDGKPYWADGWWGDPNSPFTRTRPRFSSLGNPSSDFIWGGDTVRTNLHVYLLSMTNDEATLFITYTPPAILTTDAVTSTTLALEPSWPNPVIAGAQTSMVAFTLPAPAHVDLLVHDVTGRIVARPLSSSLAAGRHVRTLDVQHLGPGTYWYVLSSNGTQLRRSFTIIR